MIEFLEIAIRVLLCLLVLLLVIGFIIWELPLLIDIIEDIVKRR